MSKRRRITFINIHNDNDLHPPVPAETLLPEWYRQTPAYINNNKVPAVNENTAATIKKCMPVFDALTSGYYILSPADIMITQEADMPFVRWRGEDTIRFHPLSQATKHPHSDGMAFMKWVNEWIIQTPRGYSCLIINPVHRKSPFHFLEAVVDTDNYYLPIEFICSLTDPKFEGTIPAGTPIVQVIPFKRDHYKMRFGKKDETLFQKNVRIIQKHFYNAYKTFLWNRKEYK